jgi:hypothetical protein
MFLISLVALLGLANGTFAAEITWDGGGADDSVCTPENWDTDTVPGPADRGRMEYRGDGENTAVVDCVWDVGDLRMPAHGGCGAGPTTLNVVSGGVINAGGGRAGDDGCDIGVLNLTGTGMMNVDGEYRFFDDGWTGTLNISDDAMINVAGRWRSGDSGDANNVTFNIMGGSIVVGDEYFRLGDDGGGFVNISGGSLTVLNGRIRWICRENTQIITVTGGEQWCSDQYEIGGSTGGKDPETYCLMNMSGGIINAGNIRVGGGYEDTTLNLSGGLMKSRSYFHISKPANDTAVVNLTGGVLEVDGEISIEAGSSMDIEAPESEGGPVGSAGGTIILDGNKLANIAALQDAGTLTGCGNVRGLVMDYDVRNPGKTTVTATCNIDPCQAWKPNPANGADKVRSVVTEVVLEWAAGDCLGTRGRHLIYFGSDAAAVAAAEMGDPEYLGFNLAGNTSINVGNLPLWSTWYWRIDEFNQDATITRGLLWSFTTGCEAIPGDINMDCLVNFDDYALLAATFGEEEFWPE